MLDLELMCNVRTCRKVLTADMWVTSCSHIFCQEHAEPSGKGKCKACGTPLLKRYDIVRTHANPPEDFKSMLLTGYRPDVVIDIAGRAIAFWQYQIAQEMNFQVEFAKHTTLKADKAANDYHTTLLGLRNELKLSKQKCDERSQNIYVLLGSLLPFLSEAVSLCFVYNIAQVKEMDAVGRKMQELRDQLEEKNKQMRMMQKTFNSLKLKTVGKTSDVVHDLPDVSIGLHNYQKRLGGKNDTIHMQPFPMMGDAPVNEQEEHSAVFVHKKRDFSFQPIVESTLQNSHQFLSQPTQETSKFYSRKRRPF